VRTDFTTNSTDDSYGLVEQPDGKLVVAGGTNGNFAVGRYNASVGTERLYATSDAQASVTALVNPAGQLVERQVLDPYGKAKSYTANFQPKWSSSFGWNIAYQGGRVDAGTNLTHFRHRWLHATLGRWTQRDPAGYVDGGSLYSYVRSAPVNRLDYLGLTSSTMEEAEAKLDAALRALDEFTTKGKEHPLAKRRAMILAETTRRAWSLLRDRLESLCAGANFAPDNKDEKDCQKCTEESCKEEAREIAALIADGVLRRRAKQGADIGGNFGNLLSEPFPECNDWLQIVIKSTQKVTNRDSNCLKVGEYFGKWGVGWDIFGIILKHNWAKISLNDGTPVNDGGPAVPIDPWPSAGVEIVDRLFNREMERQY
jgi:RHS repeat-associated protein